MRALLEITVYEIAEVNNILKDEYSYSAPLKTARDIEYQCFVKSTSVYSGLSSVLVYNYLKSVGIAIISEQD